MASPKSKDSDYDDKAGPSSEKEKQAEQDKIECAVCLQPCVQPVQLPCKHIFCYLCVKGVTHQSKRCAMCRQEIPSNYLENPCLVSAEPSPAAFEDSHQWFYEGRNGWWQYDQRTSIEIETAYKADKKQCEVLIAGFLYVIDFESNVQYRRCDPSRRRKIKRDLVTAPKKGVAGIRLSSCDDAVTTLQTLNLSDNENSSDACCSPSKTSTSEAVDSSCPGSTVPSKRFKASAMKHPAASNPVTAPASQQRNESQKSQQSSAYPAVTQQCVLPSIQLSFPSFSASSVQIAPQPIVISILPGAIGAQVPVVASAGCPTGPPAQSGDSQASGSASANVGPQICNNSNSVSQANQRKRSLHQRRKANKKTAVVRKQQKLMGHLKQKAIKVLRRRQPKRKCKKI